MSGHLDGKVALVTGSGQNIGRSIALAMASEGASVVVNSLSEPLPGDDRTAADTLREIEERGGRGAAVLVDVSTAEGARTAVDAAISSFGAIDILVNNVGSGRLVKRIEEIELDEWTQQLAVNLSSGFFCSRLVVGAMRDRGFGRIISMTSGLGLFGCAAMTPYGAAKAGVIGFTLSLAQELEGTGVTANCIAPSASNPRSERTRAQRAALTGRMITSSPYRIPDALGPPAVFLASDAAAGWNGQVMYCGGGEIRLYPWPPAPLTVLKTGMWTIDELEESLPKAYGSDRSPARFPLPLG
jgi:3-oxoacyl-[acyl-carrier protein] reductase